MDSVEIQRILELEFCGHWTTQGSCRYVSALMKSKAAKCSFEPECTVLNLGFAVGDKFDLNSFTTCHVFLSKFNLRITKTQNLFSNNMNTIRKYSLRAFI